MEAVETGDRQEDAHQGPGPRDRHHRDTPRRPESEEGDRGKAAGDQYEDHGVVDVLH